jgi:hypothetical protein
MDYSRQIKCNNSQGGNSKVYLFPFVEYLDSEITVSNNILTDFPYNVIYDMNAVNINFSLDAKQDNDIEYSEKISFQLKKLSEKDKFKEYLQQDYRIIIKDNNGNIRLFGLQNGLLGSYKEESGTNRNEFSGYSFNFEGKEENSAPYLNNLDLFGVMNLDDLLITDGQGNLLTDGQDNIITN